MADNFDFIAIGDITTDAFIRLRGNAARIERSGERKKQICFNFGDKIEYEKLVEVPAVGNSPNAAVSACRLGLKAALVTNIGDDARGKQCIDRLNDEGVDIEFVKVHPGKKSNYHFVLWYEEERTILVKHYEYPYELPDMGTPQWLYLSSLGENSVPFHHAIAEYLEKNPTVKLTFQPGTFQIQLGYDTLKNLYTHTELFFCNVQEAQRILESDETDIKKLLIGMRELGPKIIVITDGPEGAYTFDGEEKWHMPMYPDPAPPLDRTGAGDSFASTFTSMLALGKPIPDALQLAPINSMSVVQHVGAQEGLLTLNKLEEYLAEAPEDFKPAKIG